MFYSRRSRPPGSILFLSLWLAYVGAAAQSDLGTQPQGTREQLRSLEERLSKIEGAPAKTSISAFNPAMGMALDTALTDNNDKAGFQFRSAELNIEAPIDPFLKGWGVITGSNGNPALDIEEAALETTSLPCSLIVRGGRLFASFGRLAHFHDHELPVVDRPKSLNTFIGGETRADGLEVSYLFPTDIYINAVLGAYDKIGADNARQDPAGARPFDEFTYLGRLSAYHDLGDNHSVELGADSAWTPKRAMTEDVTASGSAGGALITRKNTWRALSGLDFTYRYQPTRRGLYRGVLWGTEVLQNNERRFNPATRLPAGRTRALAGYSYVQIKTGPRWRPGVMVDLTEDMDNQHVLTKTLSAFLTYDATEFQRLRLVVARASDNVPGTRINHIVSLQWTGVMGHHVHGFRDR